jgi:hypothetical protein
MQMLWNLVMAPFLAMLDLPRAVLRLSLPARIALLVTVFLLIVVLFGVTLRVLDGDDSWSDRIPQLGALLLLLVVTPPVVYMAARLWLEKDIGRWPDILAAWQEALVELGRQGVRLTDTPLFLVVGATDDGEEERLLSQAAVEFSVRAAPSGAAALHAYGGPDAAFLCIATASHASHAARRGPLAAGGRSVFTPPARSAASMIHNTIDAGAHQGADGEAESPASGVAPAPAGAAAGGDIHGTIQLDALGPVQGVARRPAEPLSAVDRDRLDDRLKYLCELVRQERRGIAPVNGVLALVPWSLLGRSPEDAAAYGRALGDDLAGLARGLGLRAPVTVLVTGLHDEPGFRELVRRMPAAGLDARIGQRFPIGAAPSHDQLGHVATRSCGMVEDQINGRILRQPGTVAEPANADLIALVCRLRSEAAPRLSAILRRAFAPHGSLDDTAPLFSGCYLAADGAGKGQMAFVKGVFEKVLDGQGDLEWTREAEAENARAAGAARVLWILSGVVLAVVAGLLGFKFLGSAGAKGESP